MARLRSSLISLLIAALVVNGLFDAASGQGFDVYSSVSNETCCTVDVVILIDRGYFPNGTALGSWAPTSPCMDIRLAVVEFADSVLVVYNLNNFSTPEEALNAGQNYTTSFTDLGTGHNAELAYAAANELLTVENGRRSNATAFVILVTGSDVSNSTNQTSGNSSNSALLEIKSKAIAMVVAAGENYNKETLEQYATSMQYFFQVVNMTDRPANTTSPIEQALCPAAFSRRTCCYSDVAFVIDRAYFATLNESEQQSIITNFFNSTDLSCPDLQISIVEYGSNASVTLYLNNFTSPSEWLPFVQNYTLGPDLGPDHDVALALRTVRTVVFAPGNGFRPFEISSFAVIITGSDPTNQTDAEAEARLIETELNTAVAIQAIGDNFTMSNLFELASSPWDYYQTSLENATSPTGFTEIYLDICLVRPMLVINANQTDNQTTSNQTNTCCAVDIVYIVDNAFFLNNVSLSDQTIFTTQAFNDTILTCPDVRVAIVEYGSNASVIFSFANFTTLERQLKYVQAYLVGPSLGSDHNLDQAYSTVRTQVLTPEAGHRNGTTVIIVITGSNVTDPSAAQSEFQQLEQEGSILKMDVVVPPTTPDDLSMIPALQEYTSSFVDFFVSATNASINSSFLYADVCGGRNASTTNVENGEKCCIVDVVLVIDQAYFSNQSQPQSDSNQTQSNSTDTQSNSTQSQSQSLNSILQSMFTSTCMDIRISIVQFGSNATVSYYLSDFSSSEDALNAVRNFQLGAQSNSSSNSSSNSTSTDLGTEHNVNSAYELINNEVLTAENGRRQEATAYVILLTGADPTNQTSQSQDNNQTSSSNTSSDALVALKSKAISVVGAVGNSFNQQTLELYATSLQYFILLPSSSSNNNDTSSNSTSSNSTSSNSTSTPSPIEMAICPGAFSRKVCCYSDVAFVIDRAYFSTLNESQQQEIITNFFNNTDLSCPDLQIAIVEFGTNVSVTLYLNNFTSPSEWLPFLQNYTLGPDLGPDHDVANALRTVRTVVFAPGNGFRPIEITSFAVIITGSDPTNQTDAEAEARLMETELNTAVAIQAIGDNFTMSNLFELASSPWDYYQTSLENATSPTGFDKIFLDICLVRPMIAITANDTNNQTSTCCAVDIVYIVDNAFFLNNVSLSDQTIFTTQAFNDTILTCPDVRVAIVEYGSNASVIFSFANFTTLERQLKYVQAYLVGPSLGSDHNLDQAYSTVRTQVLTPEGGHRNGTTVIIVITGANVTDPSATQTEFQQLEQEGSILKMDVVVPPTTPDDLSMIPALQEYTSSFADFFVSASNASINSSFLYADVCGGRNASTPNGENGEKCCTIDVVLIIDQAYFLNQSQPQSDSNQTQSNSTDTQSNSNQTSSNQTQSQSQSLNSILQNMFTSTCMDIRIAIVQFGSNATVSYYLSDFSSSEDALNAVRNFQLGAQSNSSSNSSSNSTSTDLGTEHNVNSAYELINNEVLTAENGRRQEATAYVILITGADPTNQTSQSQDNNQTSSSNTSSNALLITKTKAISVVGAVGDSFDQQTLQLYATSLQYFIRLPSSSSSSNMSSSDNSTSSNDTSSNSTSSNSTSSPSPIEMAICPGAFFHEFCCFSDVALIIDRAYFATFDNATQQQLISSLFSNPKLSCPDLRIAVIEYGSNVSVTLYLNNFTSPSEWLPFLQNYTLGPDLGSGQDLALALRTARNVLAPGNGRRDINVIGVAGVIIGTLPANMTEAENEARLLEIETNAVVTVNLVGTNVTSDVFFSLASSPWDTVELPFNSTDNSTTIDFAFVFSGFCGERARISINESTNCCPVDVVFVVDNPYFNNNVTVLDQYIHTAVAFNNSLFGCPDVRVAIVEYGSNATVILSFNNFTTLERQLKYLQGYVVGPSLGSDHNLDLGFNVVRTQVLTPEGGHRDNATTIIVIISGMSATNESGALSEAQQLEQQGAIIKVEAIGHDNFFDLSALPALQQYTSSFADFFVVMTNVTMNSSYLYNEVCEQNATTAGNTTAGNATCCTSDIVFVIDRAFFGNSSNSDQLQQQLAQTFNSSFLACDEVNIAIVEFGSNVSVIVTFNNFTTSDERTAFLLNYTLGPDLGPDHNVDLAFATVRTQVIGDQNGGRSNAIVVVILITGASATNQSAAISEMQLLVQHGAIVKVEILSSDDNSSVSSLQEIASSSIDFVVVGADNSTTVNTSLLYDYICTSRNVSSNISGDPCCRADVVFLVDRGFFTGNDTNRTSILLEAFNSSDMMCPELQVAIVEFGDDAAVVIYLNNFTNPTDRQAFLQSYTPSQDVGTGSNASAAYALVSSAVLTPENGRRDDASTTVVLITGGNITDLAAAEAAAAVLIQQNVTLIVEVASSSSDNSTTDLSGLASSPENVFTVSGSSDGSSINLSELFTAICAANATAPSTNETSSNSTSNNNETSSNATSCCAADIVFLIDAGLFTNTSSNQAMNSSNFLCPDIQIAIVEFGGDNATVITFLNNVTTTDSLQSFISFDGTNSSIIPAFNLTASEVLVPENGRRSNVTAFVILITAGNLTDAASAQSVASSLNATVIVIVVGSESSSSIADLQGLASSPDDFFQVNNATDFNSLPLFEIICPESQNETNNATTPAFNETTTTAPFNASTTPSFNETSTPSFNETSTPSFNETSTPSFNETSTPSFNETTTPSSNETTTTAPFNASTTTSSNFTSIDATSFCFSCQGRANTRSLFPNPDDCHTFYQCFFNSPSTAIGILMHCPPGTYFRSELQTCAPEGDIPCQDQCENTDQLCMESPDNCAEFFVCSNGVSYAQCCPMETRFNAEFCACEDDPSCTDSCVLSSGNGGNSGGNQTSSQPQFTIEGDTCTDVSSGIQFRAVAGRPDIFQAIDSSYARRIRTSTMSCPPGTSFKLPECGCSIGSAGDATPATSIATNMCMLYLPFDTNFNDVSVNKFSTFAYGNASINTAEPAVGAGSLYVSGGRIEIPGLQDADIQSPSSVCFFFRCEEGGTCTVNGGLLSNNRDGTGTEYSMIMAESSNNFEVRLQLRNPRGTIISMTVDLATGATGSTVSSVQQTTTPGLNSSSTTPSFNESTTSSSFNESTTSSSFNESTTSSSFNESTTSSFSSTTSSLNESTTTSSLSNETTTGFNSSSSENTTTSGAGGESTTPAQSPGNGGSSPPPMTSVSGGEWHHICVVNTATETTLYLNGNVVQVVQQGGSLRLGHCPYVVGTDQQFGDFTGSIDEVLMCETAFTAEDVSAHMNGDRAALVSRGFFAQQA